MPRFWKERLRTGVHSIDTQHQLICRAIEALVDLLREGQQKGQVEQFLKCLIAYSKIHFREEEELFRAAGLPEADIRQQMFEHFQFEDVLRGLEHKWRAGEKDAADFAEKVTLQWVKGHVEDLDVPMVRLAHERQGRESTSLSNPVIEI